MLRIRIKVVIISKGNVQKIYVIFYPNTCCIRGSSFSRGSKFTLYLVQRKIQDTRQLLLSEQNAVWFLYLKLLKVLRVLSERIQELVCMVRVFQLWFLQFARKISAHFVFVDSARYSSSSTPYYVCATTCVPTGLKYVSFYYTILFYWNLALATDTVKCE